MLTLGKRCGISKPAARFMAGRWRTLWTGKNTSPFPPARHCSRSGYPRSIPTRQQLLVDAARRGCSYLEQLDQRSVAPSEDAVAALARLGGPLPELAQDPAAVLALLDEFGSPA